MARTTIKSAEYTEVTTTKDAFTIQNVGTDKIFIVGTNNHVAPTSGGWERYPQQTIVIQKSDYAYVYIKSASYTCEIEVAE